MNSKFALQSTAVQGILVMLVAAFLPKIVEVSNADAMVHAQALVESVSGTVAAAAAIWALRGRKDATTAIHFVPGANQRAEKKALDAKVAQDASGSVLPPIFVSEPYLQGE
jgi:ABC-type long-subunit fatty acid transport system fused permease/ATPase subunit